MNNNIHSILKHKETIIVLGRSGSGKGTQTDLLLENIQGSVHRVETGNFLRAVASQNHPTGLLTREVLESGGLMPAWLASYIWLKDLIEGGHGDKHLVMDGAVRRVWEAALMDEVMGWHGRPLPICLDIDVPKEEVTRRLLARGRDDDNEVAIRNRMDYYERHVVEVLEYYRERNRLVSVNGMQEPADVHRSVIKALRDRLGDTIAAE